MSLLFPDESLYYGGIALTIITLLLFLIRALVFRKKEARLTEILDEEYGVWRE